MGEIKTSIDTMREAAWELLVQQGWKPGSQLSGHSAVGLMAEFGMRVYRGEVGCDYPDCGCGADAACGDAVKQHPDLGGTPTPQPNVEAAARAFMELFVVDNGDRGLTIEDVDANEMANRYADLETALNAAGLDNAN